MSTLSQEAKNELVWVACSGVAQRLTAAEGQAGVAAHFGSKVLGELQRYFAVPVVAEEPREVSRQEARRISNEAWNEAVREQEGKR